MESLVRKERDLLDALSAMGSVIVAYSGGADSAYLAWASQRALGDRALALTADSASLPESHKRDAEKFARTWGIRHEYVATQEFDKSAMDERTDVANLSQSLRQDLSAKGLQFNDVDHDSFRNALRKTSFYKDWRAKFGEQAWSLLEASAGTLT